MTIVIKNGLSSILQFNGRFVLQEIKTSCVCNLSTINNQQ